jgi:hypothetical protein
MTSVREVSNLMAPTQGFTNPLKVGIQGRQRSISRLLSRKDLESVLTGTFTGVLAKCLQKNGQKRCVLEKLG